MAEPLKEMYSPEVVEHYARLLRQVRPRFDAAGFVAWVQDARWPELSLMQRVDHLADALAHWIPGDYTEQLKVIDGMQAQVRGFVHIAIPAFVARHGLERPEESLPALARYTEGSSAEFALRPFLARYPQTWEYLHQWARHANPHVRRLASEGCRPRLPWGKAVPGLKADPAPILPILETLRADDSEYVRRSVANNLNDIGKDHPALLKQLAQNWWGVHAPTDALLRHALRTLLKKGDPEALAIVGHGEQAALRLVSCELSHQHLRIGDTLRIVVEVENAGDMPVPLRLEYAVHYRKANGSLSPKVFQITQTSLDAGQSGVWQIGRPLRDFTTRKHYPGEHFVQVILNGRRQELVPFYLE
ncbi:MAG: DNA alkylation repair protein [Bacteroidetes bacterium]|nr:DNA alkylation repair protein [Bacteroidota bacterium]